MYHKHLLCQTSATQVTPPFSKASDAHAFMATFKDLFTCMRYNGTGKTSLNLALFNTSCINGLK